MTRRPSGETDGTYFPPDLIPTTEKDHGWHLNWCKAAWLEYTSLVRGSLYLAHDKYSTIMAYLQGEQSIRAYQSQLEVGDEENEAWINLDWTPVKWLAGLRDAAIARVSKRDYQVTLTPIDPLAEEEREAVLRHMEARLLIRETMEQIEPGSSENSQFVRSPGEPEDRDELELMRNFTFKHNLAMQGEQLIDVILNANKFNETRRQLKDDLFSFGVAGVREWIDSAGNVKVRRVNPSHVITSPCQNRNYSDIRYAGEIRRLLVADLVEEAGDQFTHEQYVDIARNFIGKFGNPTPVADEDIYQNYKDYKIEVADMEWYSLEAHDWEFRTNKFGNLLFGHARVDRKDQNVNKNRYIRTKFKVVHSAQWIVQSNYIYNWGLATNMKRKRKSIQDTQMSFHFRATDFYQNRVVSMAERLISFADQLQILWMKYQMLTQKLRDNGYAIEVGALEDIDLGGGGKVLQPMDILDLFQQKGYLLYRRMDLAGNPSSWMPITELRGSTGEQLSIVWNQILQKYQFMKQMIGFNDLTDGTTYDPRALKTAVAAAQESSNNALWKLVIADFELFEEVCDSVMQRGQTVIRAGGRVSGYTTAIGRDTTIFFEASPELGMYDFGLKIDAQPTEEERQQLIEESKQFVAADLLDISDLMLIRQTTNLKQAQMILAIKVKRRRKEREVEQLRSMEMTGQMQQQAAMIAAQAKQQEITMEHQARMEQIELEWKYRLQIAELQAAAQMEMEQLSDQASLIRQGAASTTKLLQERMKQKQTTGVVGKDNGEEAEESDEME